MKHRISLAVIIATVLFSAVGLYLFLNLTNPLSAGPAGILAVFILIYVFSFSLLLLVARLLEVVYGLMRLPVSTAVKEDKTRLWRRRTTFVVATLSFIPIFLVSLNSIGQLDFKDVTLVVVIEALLVFYIIRRV